MNSKIREAAQIILSETDSKWFVELDSAEKLSNLKDALIERGFEDEVIGANEEWLQSEIESYFAE